MKLTVDLEDAYGYDDESVAQMMRTAIREEVQRFAKRLAKDALKKQEAEARKMVEQAANKDWKRIAALLDQLQGEQ